MLVKSSQIANPIIAIVDPVLYCSICMFANLLIANIGKTHNSQLVDTCIKKCPMVMKGEYRGISLLKTLLGKKK